MGESYRIFMFINEIKPVNKINTNILRFCRFRFPKFWLQGLITNLNYFTCLFPIFNLKFVCSKRKNTIRSWTWYSRHSRKIITWGDASFLIWILNCTRKNYRRKFLLFLFSIFSCLRLSKKKTATVRMNFWCSILIIE